MTTEGHKAHVSSFFNRSDGWKGDFYRDPNDTFGQMLVRRKEHVLRLFAEHVDGPGAAIFDAGCGPGEYLVEFAGRVRPVCGMDASEEMLRSSGETLRGAGARDGAMLIRGDLENVPVRSGSFDAILCIGVLGYLEEDAGALRELHRLLRPGGHLLVNVRNLNALTSLYASARLKLRYLRSNGWGKLRTAVSLATHTREGGWKSRAYNVGRFEREVESAGFRRVGGLTFGYEFKLLGALGLSGRSVAKIEGAFERLMLAVPARASRYAGWGYIGVFRKDAAG
jgi:ubiquinone/menaquinone biosynthesis C-methylase UbiE